MNDPPKRIRYCIFQKSKEELPGYTRGGYSIETAIPHPEGGWLAGPEINCATLDEVRSKIPKDRIKREPLPGEGVFVIEWWI